MGWSPHRFAAVGLLPVKVSAACVGIGAVLKFSDVSGIAGDHPNALGIFRFIQIDVRHPFSAINPAAHDSHQ